MSRAAPTIGGKYVVQEGDTITEIAFQAYGDARRYAELCEHNRGVEGFAPACLTPGLVLEVPEPDYLPMPSGIGGMRTSAGRAFKVEPVTIEPPTPPSTASTIVPLSRLRRA